MTPGPEDLPLRRRIVLVKEVELHLNQGPTKLCVRKPLDVHAALVRPPAAPLRLVADFEFASPRDGLDTQALAAAYAEAGAAMLRIPCDRRFLGGSWDLLAAVRARLDEVGRAVPLLANDFVIDAKQVAWARDAGADALLLNVGLVPRTKLVELATAAQCAELEPVFEVVDEAELQTALACGARVIGVNARDLDSQVPNSMRAARVLEAIPPGVVAVHFASVTCAEDVHEVARSGAHAAFVGVPLLPNDDPCTALRGLVAACG